MASLITSLGAWVILDVVLVASALTTAALVLAWGGVSPLTLVVGGLVLVASVFAATLHLSVRAYA